MNRVLGLVALVVVLTTGPVWAASFPAKTDKTTFTEGTDGGMVQLCNVNDTRSGSSAEDTVVAVRCTPKGDKHVTAFDSGGTDATDTVNHSWKVSIVASSVGGLTITDAASITGGQSGVSLVAALPFSFDGVNWTRTGCIPYKTVSTASTNATSVKGAVGVLYMGTAWNTNAAARWVHLYNKASAPTVGTDVAVQDLLIPGNTAGGGYILPIPSTGMVFSTGIAFATTTGPLDSDTGAVGANEVGVNLCYK